ncbi:MAG TPA: hypothetical protein EYP46_00680 [Hadesarchaea archaeon]|nr:hypothetical protein [Hadesarchaea archaeon]
MKLIIAPKDPAAKNIATRLLEFYDFEKFHDIPGSYICGQVMLIHAAGEATQLTSIPITADEVMVASRHISRSGEPSLTVHVPGEPEKRELGIASPSTVKSALRALVITRDEMELPYEVSLEATHHGPTKLEVPVTFVEIGSTPNEWQNKKAGEAAAQAIMAAATSSLKCTNAVGFGGPHYAPRHTEITLRTEVGVGHILPKYSPLDEMLVERAVSYTYQGVKLFVLDWKGMSKEQRMICQRVTTRLGIKLVRAGQILNGL